MSNDGISWAAFPAVSITDGSDIGWIVAMNRPSSRNFSLVPHKFMGTWKYTGDCVKRDNKAFTPKGEVLDIASVLEEWGVKPLKAADRILTDDIPNLRLIRKLISVKEWTDQTDDGRFVFKMKVYSKVRDWGEFELAGPPSVDTTGAASAFWEILNLRTAKCVEIHRAKSSGVQASEAELLADMCFE